MQQNHQRAVARVGVDDVQGDAVGFDVIMLKLGNH